MKGRALRGAWFLVFLLACAWVYHSGYRGLSGQDSHDYYGMARGWYAWLHGGERPPAAVHPMGFPLAGALYASLSGGHVLSGLWGVVLLCFLALGSCMMSLVRRRGLTGQQADAYVLLAVGASPFLLRYALMVLSDVPALAAVLTACQCIMLAVERRRKRWYAGAIVAFGLALFMRYACAPVVVAAAAYVFVRRLQGRRRAWALILLVLGGSALGVLCTLRPGWLADLMAGTPVEHWSALNLFRSEHLSDDGQLRYRLPNLVYVLTSTLHPGFLPIGVVLLPFIRWADVRGFLPGLFLCLLSVYLLFAAGLPFQNDRVMLLGQPLVAVLLAPAFGRAWVWLVDRRWRPLLLFAVLAVVQLGMFVRAMDPFLRLARTERELCAALRTRGITHVYTHGMGPALGSYCPGVGVTDLWSVAVDRFPSGALLLVRPADLEEHWMELNPGKNWRLAQASGLDEVYRHPAGWVLMRVR